MTSKVEQEYIRRVAIILDRTGHPRRGEVLEDLETHLQELNAVSGEPAELNLLMETLGPPEEYAENLAPATGYRPKPMFRRREFLVGAAVLIAIFGAAIAATINRHYLAAKFREFRGRNFSSTPFFSLAKAKSLKPGDDENTMRDALGYPIRRYSLVGREDEIVWEYTTSHSAYAPFYTWCRVVTDAKNWNFLRLDLDEHLEIGNPPEERIVLRPKSVKVGSLSLPSSGQTQLTLKPDDPLLHVLSVTDIAPERNVEERISSKEGWIIKSWTDVPWDKIRFVHILRPLRMEPEALTQLVNDTIKNRSDDIVVCPQFAENLFPVRSENEIWLYHRGTLYEYPPIWGSGDARIEQSYRDDQNWLIHRLLEE